jgi:nucleotide-binding universal stress UspA family protein
MSATSAPPQVEPGPRPKLGELSFHRLLVAIDGSVNADMALAAAVTAARRDHASLTLITVVADVAAEAARWAGAAGPPPQIQDEADAEAERTLREAVERLPDDLPVTTVVRRGKAGPEIVGQARAGDYDAILLGARGVGRVGALLGSVSHYVLHHADTAVLVAHAPREPR